MKAEDYKDALEIITASRAAIKVSFNVPVKDNYSNVHQIIIHECNATTINLLVNAKYSLFMTDKGLAVDKF
ncbi:MAG: hypothetical protein LBS25_00670 [Candidatus Symbiothrix sp.]|jgi:hypothetical protein|nr:hypothetical protein [Candidatus Symbiothrix sp.]